MVKSVENGTSLAPFLVKCYEMVSDESTDDLISWAESGDSFIIRDEARFASQLLSKYFKHSNFSSFVRQLNIYGFRKIDTDMWQFANEAFIKGQKHLLKNIRRRKHPQSQAIAQRNIPPQQNNLDHPTPPLEENRIDLYEEVEKLKADRSALMLELKKLRQNQQSSQSKMLLVREQLKCMEKNQQQMLSFIVMAMQSPEFLIQFFQPKDNSWRVSESGDRKLSEVTDDIEQTPSEKMIVMYQPPPNDDENLSPPSAEPTFGSDDFMGLDFSSDGMENLLMDIDILLGQMDDNQLPLENNGQLIIPDIPGHDILMDQLLDDEELGEHESDSFSEFLENVNSSFTQESKKSGDSDDEDRNQITEAIHRMEV